MASHTVDAVWTGASSNLWATAANWSPANEPTVNEDILIPAGTWNIDCTGMTDLQLGVLNIARGFAGSIGTSGQNLVSSFTVLRHRGAGKLYFTDGAGTTTAIIIDGPEGADVADITGANGAVVALSCVGGITNWNSASGTLARMEVGPKARVIIGASSSAIALLLQSGGAIECARAITIAYLGGGTFRQVKGATQAVATMNIFPGASVFIENGTTVTAVNGLGGSLDVVRNRVTDLTITTANMYPGFTLIEDALTLITNRNDWRN